MSQGETIFGIMLVVFILVTSGSCRCIHGNCITVTRMP